MISPDASNGILAQRVPILYSGLLLFNDKRVGLLVESGGGFDRSRDMIRVPTLSKWAKRKPFDHKPGQIVGFKTAPGSIEMRHDRLPVLSGMLEPSRLEKLPRPDGELDHHVMSFAILALPCGPTGGGSASLPIGAKPVDILEMSITRSVEMGKERVSQLTFAVICCFASHVEVTRIDASIAAFRLRDSAEVAPLCMKA